MQPKLKETPREWQKFSLVLSALVGVLTWIAWRRGWLPQEAWIPAGAIMALLPLIALVQPMWFRPIYSGGMIASFHVGQVVGKVLLVMLFLVIVTPLGLLLRVAGKDLLSLRRRSGQSTYWHEAKPPGRLDQMF